MKLFFFLLVTYMALNLYGQQYVQDFSFETGTGFNIDNPDPLWSGISSTGPIVIQPDGKIIVGGAFTNYNGAQVNSIVRLNSNGSIDNSFNVGTGFTLDNGNGMPTGIVNSIKIQQDGKIIVCGAFTHCNGSLVNGIVRLNNDGTRDISFNVGSGFNLSNGEPYDCSIQSDGKIIVVGSFTSYKGIASNRLIRLNNDGSLDGSFNIGSGFDSGAYTCAIQSDGKIIIGGHFGVFNLMSTGTLIRLNNNGALDLTFNTGSGFTATIENAKIQLDGKIIVCGGFTDYNGVLTNKIARLNQDGSLDITFNSGSGFNISSMNEYPSSISILSNGKIIVGGQFTSYNGIPSNNIILLNSDGTLNSNFLAGSGFNNGVGQTSTLLDGKIIVGGRFTNFNNIQSNRLIRLKSCSSATFDTISEIVQNCVPYISPGNNEYSVAGVYNEILQNIDGCDSVYLTINLNEAIIYFDTVNAIVQNCIPFVSPSGNQYLTDGTYYETLYNSYGCDSVYLTVNISTALIPTEYISVETCSSYTSPNNNQYSQTGIYSEIISSAQNCDSVNLIIFLTNNSTTNTINASLGCGSYILNGQQYTNPGQYNQILTNQFGCDSLITLNLYEYFGTTTSVQPATCNGNAPDGSISVSFSGYGNGANTVQGNGIFFSEYFMAGSNNIILEIYNSSGNPIDLGANFADPSAPYTAYLRLKNSTNQEYSFVPNTIIAPYSTLLISNPNSGISADISTPIIDGTTITAFVWLNSPLNQPQIIDVAKTSNYYTYIRKQTVTNYNPVYDPNEWIISSLSSITLDSHWPEITTNPGYTIEWDNGTANNSITNIAAGNYVYNVLFNGCVVESQIVNVPWSGSLNSLFSSSQQLFTSPPFAVQFTNSSNNPGVSVSYFWDFGDGTILASNNSTVFHQYLFNGLYTVSLIATNNNTGCSDTTTLTDYIFCTGGVSCTHTAAINQTSPQQACQGTPLWLSCNNDPSFSYQWRRNGVTIPGNNNDSLLVTQSGTYSVIISVNNCPVSSGDVVVNILSTPTTPVITSSGAIQPCVGGSVTLNVGSYATYNWSTGATTQSISVSNSGAFTVSVTNANGCSATSAPFIVNASFVASPQICIVGMDSLTNENRIVWEKPITNGIDSFYVYKESNVSNVYTKIGATNYNDLAVFLDVNSNPAVQAYRYKISALDTCGVETNVGDFHKTIHLTINQGVGSSWNLIWSNYEGINFGSYNIYRGTDPSNISLLTTIQSTLSSYTDLTPPAGPLYYQIEVVNPVNCDPNKSINYGISRSNIVNNGLVGITEEIIPSMQVYPNPTNDKLTLGVSNDLLGKQYFITDFSGRIILQGKINMLNQIIELTNVSNGSYLLQVENSNVKAIKIVKQ